MVAHAISIPIIPIIILVLVIIGFIIDRSFTWNLLKEIGICLGLAVVFTLIINLIIRIPTNYILIVLALIAMALFVGHYANQRKSPYADQLRS